MFLSSELWELLHTEGDDPETEERLGLLQADLEFFVTSETIDPKYLFHLYPARDGVWEIRSVRPDPSIRVLGLFVKKDFFIATNHALRADLEGWQSREWKTVKRMARTKWAQLFHPYEPTTGVDVTKLVTGALDGRYFKERG
jgi:hypothetical protein